MADQLQDNPDEAANEAFQAGVFIENQPVPSHLELEASLEDVEREINMVWDRFQDLFETYDEQTQQKVEAFREKFHDASQDARAKNEPEPRITTFFGDEDLPEEYKQCETADEKLMDKHAALEAELEGYAPEKARDVMQKAAELEDSIDYDQLVSKMANSDDYELRHRISLVIGLPRLLDTDETPTYSRLQFLEGILETYSSEWRENGIIPEHQLAETVEAVDTVESSVLNPAEVRQLIYEVQIIRHKYKHYDPESHRLGQELGASTHKLEKFGDNGEDPTIDDLLNYAKVIHNDAMTAAISRYLTQKLQELPAQDYELDTESNRYKALVEAAGNIDPIDALKNMEVTASPEGLPFEFSKYELLVFLHTYIPPLALDRVKKIEFRPLTKEEDEEDNTMGFHTYSEELGGSVIVVSDARVRENYELSLLLMGGAEHADTVAKLLAKKRMFRTIAHEFGHALHFALPAAALKEYEDQRASDPINVTEYVKDQHDKDHPHRYKEDFADPVALFITQPEVLKIISPTRFDAMQRIFETFMPAYAGVTKKLQERKISEDKVSRAISGISDDRVREIYLVHEKTEPVKT